MHEPASALEISAAVQFPETPPRSSVADTHTVVPFIKHGLRGWFLKLLLFLNLSLKRFPFVKKLYFIDYAIIVDPIFPLLSPSTQHSPLPWAITTCFDIGRATITS